MPAIRRIAVLALASLAALTSGIAFAGGPVAHANDRSNGAVAAASDDVTDASVTVYGATWCGPCHSLQASLKERGIPFDLIDIDKDPDAYAWARKTSKTSSIPLTSILRTGDLKWVVGANPDAVEKAYRGE